MLFGLTQRRRRLAHLQPHPGWRPVLASQEINRSNVAQLKAICTYTLPEVSSLQTGPLVVDGTMYFTTDEGSNAIDGSTCAEKWKQHRHSPTPSMLLVLGQGKKHEGIQHKVIGARSWKKTYSMI
jgi:hypothetical protein